MDLGRGLGAEPLEVRALLSSQTVSLIKDVNAVQSGPENLTPAGSNLFYTVADDTDTGVDLMVTNAGGTQVLLDTGSPAWQGSFPDPLRFTAAGNSIFFVEIIAGTPLYQGETIETQSKLWTSNGTAAGTVPVSIQDRFGTPEILGVLGNTLVLDTHYVQEDEGIDDYLWTVSPGSTTATYVTGFFNTGFGAVGVVGGTLYLSVGGDLWSTDGTAQNTQELLNPATSQPISSSVNIFEYQGQPYYLSSNGYFPPLTTATFGIFDAGEETPTVAVIPAWSMGGPVVAGSLFYFTTSGFDTGMELWSSDGTQAGTTMIRDFAPYNLETLVDVEGSLYFTTAGADGSAQLWKSDGTSQGTSMVMDLGLPESTLYGNTYQNVLPVGGTLFFAADDGIHGDELWSDDVATGTTQLVDDIDPGPDGSDPQDLVAWDGQLDFVANDGTSPTTTQVWTSGGTAATTSIASLSPGLDGSAVPNPTAIPYGILGSQILLPLTDGIDGTALWETDGTTAGTQSLASVQPVSFAVLNGEAYFLGLNEEEGAFGLWTTDGTSGDTTELMDLNSQYNAGGEMATIGSLVYFTMGKPDFYGGLDLWASDGTVAGTNIVMSFPQVPTYEYPGSFSENPATISDMTAFDGKLAFIADAGSEGPQVWITDGTAGGTQMLTDIPSDDETAYISDPSSAAGPSDLTVLGDTLYFIAANPDGPYGSEGLWSSDGTAGHTSVLYNFPTLPNPEYPQSPFTPQGANLTVAGSSLFFSLLYTEDQDGSSSTQGQLWTSDGTASGTVQVPMPSSATPSGLFGFMAMGDQVLFRAVGSGGTALWASDGTAAGTTELKFLSLSTAPEESGYSANTVVDDGIIYFAADDGTHGTELWQSDGTTAGTFMVEDINPGAASSNPTPLAVIDGQVVLAADDGTHGFELMKLSSTPQATAPWLAKAPEQEATVGETFQLPLALYASDPNEPVLPLTYSLGTDAPAGMSIDPDTGLITWPGSADQTAGIYSFAVTVTDNGTPALSAAEAITVDVNPVQPPSVSSKWMLYITAGETLNLDVSLNVTDLNDPPFPLTYSLGAGAPAGVSITPAGTLTWVIPSGQAPATYTIPVIVADDATPQQTADDAVTVDVWAIEPPPIAAITTQTAVPGQTVATDLSQFARDVNTPSLSLTYTLINGPGGAAIDPATGQFTWATPSDQPVGPVTITFQVADSLTAASPSQESFTINFLAPPVVKPIPTQSVLDVAGEQFSFGVGDYASDPITPPLPLTYSLAGYPPAGVSIDPSSGVLTWVVPAGQPAGTTAIVVDVSDNQSPPDTATAVVTFDLTTPIIGDQSPPPPAPIVVPPSQAVHVDVGQTATVNLSSLTSEPGQPVSLTYGLGPGAPSGVSVDPTTGLLTWDVPATLRIGTYPVTFIVTSSNTPPQTASETIDLTVVDTSPPPTILTPVVRTRKRLSIELRFSVPVDPATATDAANYILTERGKKRKGHKKAAAPLRVIPLRVRFDPMTDEATLRALKKPRSRAVLTLTIVGSATGGIAKLDGLQLAGAGQPGTNYVARIRGRKISPVAAVAGQPVAPRGEKAPARFTHRPATPDLGRALAARPPGGPLLLMRNPSNAR